MEKEKIYIINAYTKDGVLDHQASKTFRDSQTAQIACNTFQSVCCSTGFLYKVDEYDFNEWLNM